MIEWWQSLGWRWALIVAIALIAAVFYLGSKIPQRRRRRGLPAPDRACSRTEFKDVK